MDTQQLVAAGLNNLQAEVYLLLLEAGEINPPDAANKLKITRSNAYKVLDRLVELRLARREEIDKKITYQATSPTALSNLVSEQRNIANAREEAVNSVINHLLTKYHSSTEQPDATVVTGKAAVIDAYRQQVNQKQPMYIIRSNNDVPLMGFDTMHMIRIYAAERGIDRYGIGPDMSPGATSPERDKRSNLKSRTWMRQEDYNSPVEWSVCGSSLLIVLFGKEPHAVTIINPFIAEAFQQIWQLLNTMLPQMSYYKSLPRQ